MKKDIHPEYNKEAKVTCVCGNSFTVGSTKEELDIEMCSNCHPFYTGVEKMVDTAGRVEKFKARRQAAQDDTKQLHEKKAEKREKREKAKS